MNEIYEKFNKFYADYLQNPESYNLKRVHVDVHFHNTTMNKSMAVPVSNDINNILTESVTKLFLKSNNTILEIINLYNDVYNYVIQQYIMNCPVNYNINNDNVFFSLKGGMAMLMSLSSELFLLPGNIGRIYHEHFIDNVFKKSDIDFSIIINYEHIPVIHRTNIYNDIYNISFITLVIIRDYIVKNKYDFSDFEKNDTEYKKYVLNIIRNNINEQNDNMDDFCKIGNDGLYEEEPCSNNVELINDVIYDEIYIHNGRKLTINRPKNIGMIKLQPQKKYIISANEISFRTNNQLDIAFGLTRMKVFFSLYRSTLNEGTIGCCKYVKGKGEIIDVSIIHPKNQTKYDRNGYEINNIDNYNFLMPTVENLSKDHYDMIIAYVKYPWDQKKYEKRIRKYFALSLILILRNISLVGITNFISFLRSCIEHLRLYDNNLSYINNPIFATLLINPDPTNNFFTEYLSLINVVKGYISENNFREHSMNLDQYFRSLIQNFNRIIMILEQTEIHIRNPTITNKQTNLDLRANMFGGFNMCDMKKSDKILKNIIDSFTQQSTDVKLVTNLHEKFYFAYKKLIKIIYNDQIIDQVFHNSSGDKIYDSREDNEFMTNNNGTPKILRNDILKYTAYMFLDYLVEYHCFLTIFEDEQIPINNENNEKNFRLLRWNNTPEGYMTFKKSLIGLTIDELLVLVCQDMNDKYYRFVTLLIKKLLKKYTRYLQPGDITTDIIVDLLFAKDHMMINKYDKRSKYNNIYHCWKNRLIQYLMDNFFKNDNDEKIHLMPVNITRENMPNYFMSGINLCIESTITSILGQHNNDNELYDTNSSGFFSYMYMNNENDQNKLKNKKSYYSSCITSSKLEIYLLLRIHELGEDVGLGSEVSSVHRHPYWKIGQREVENAGVKGHGLSHWVGKWNRVTGNPPIKQLKTFRSAYRDRGLHTLKILSSADPKNSWKQFMRSVVYISIDYYIEFIRQNQFGAPGLIKTQSLTAIADNIKRNIDTL